MIETENLVKVFRDKKRGKVRAVDGVSFQSRPGQIYGLLGANGAGKTTTLRLLATILRPTEGTAKVAGFDICRQPERVRGSIGFLSTATALYGRLTARETVEYFGRLNGLNGSALKKRVGRIFDLLEIGEFAGRRCDKLSTGMKQKVSIARTMVNDPPVMILDEPVRTVVLLRYWEGLPPRRIAARLEIPVETVRTRLKRGLHKLRVRLDGECGGRRACC